MLSQTTDYVIRRAEYDTLTGQRARYRLDAVRIKREFNNYRQQQEDKYEDLNQNFKDLGIEYRTLEGERRSLVQQLEDQKFKFDKEHESVYEANRELNAKVNQTRRWRTNVHVMRGAVVMLSVLSATLLLARSHS